MKGAERRAIKGSGKTYAVRNASGGSGGRDTPDYSGDGTLTAVLEQRGRPQTATDSDGTEIETDLELRAVVPDGTTIREAGESGGWPTKLDHPDRNATYRVMATRLEDGGVTPITVVRD